ncbi:MAG: ABC transporter permease [Fusobacteriaceae bacterium]
MKEKNKALIILLPFILIMFMFQFLPFINILLGSFKYKDIYSFDNYKIILKNKFILQSIKNSIELSIISTFLGIIISLQGAYSLNQLKKNTKNKIVLLINMIGNFSGIPLAFSFIVLLGTNGTLVMLFKEFGLFENFNLYSKNGLLLMFVYFQIPLGILLLYPIFDRLEKNCEEMCYILGGSRITYWKRIGIPLLKRDILGTVLILFANAMGAYTSVIGLTNTSYNLMTIRITTYVGGEVSYEPGLASALSIVLAGILILVVLINGIYLKRGRK